MKIGLVGIGVTALVISLSSAALALPPMDAQHLANVKFQQLATAQAVFPKALTDLSTPVSRDALCLRDDMTFIEGFVDGLVVTQGLIELGDKLKDSDDIKQADAFVALSLVALKREATSLADRAQNEPSKCAAIAFYASNPDALKKVSGLADDIVATLSGP